MIRKISATAGKDTLILFVADHSYDLKLLSGHARLAPGRSGLSTQPQGEAG